MRSNWWTAVLTAATVLVGASGAHAEPGWEKKLKKDVKKAEHTVDKDADKAEHTVDKGAGKAEHAVDDCARHPEKCEKTVDKDVKHAFSKEEMDKVGDDMRREFHDVLKDAEKGFTVAIDWMKKEFDGALAALLRDIAKKHVDKYATFLETFGSRVQALQASKDVLDLVKDMVSSAVHRRSDDHMSEDMHNLALALGLIAGKDDSIIPDGSHGLFKSTWGFGILGRGQANGGEIPVYANANLVAGVIGACYEEPGKPYEARFFFDTSASIGAGEGGEFAGGLVFFWMPGSPSDTDSFYVGVQGTFMGSKIVKLADDASAVVMSIAVVRGADGRPMTRLKGGGPRMGAGSAPGPKRKGLVIEQRGETRGGAATTESVWTTDKAAAAEADAASIGVSLGVRWRIFKESFSKHPIEVVHGLEAEVPGFYFAFLGANGAGLSGGIELTQSVSFPFPVAKNAQTAKDSGSTGGMPVK